MSDHAVAAGQQLGLGQPVLVGHHEGDKVGLVAVVGFQSLADLQEVRPGLGGVFFQIQAGSFRQFLVVEHGVGGNAIGDLADLAIVAAVLPQTFEHIVKVELRVRGGLLTGEEVAVSAGVGDLTANQHVRGGVAGQRAGDLGGGIGVAAGIRGDDLHIGVLGVKVVYNGQERFAAGAAQRIPYFQCGFFRQSGSAQGPKHSQSQYQGEELSQFLHVCFLRELVIFYSKMLL